MINIVKDWRKIDISFGLVYPNIFKIGMSSYSIRLLYSILNSHDDIACERMFIPEKIKYPASKDINPINLIRSIENKVHPLDFDIIGFSLQFENDFKNILWFLEKAGIPISSQERKRSSNKGEERYPLIIAGGPVATSNPLPFNQISDAFFIGDAEPNIEMFLKVFESYKSSEITLEEFEIKAKDIEGIYIPALKNKVSRSILKNLDDSIIPTIQSSTEPSKYSGIFENKFFVEVNRGCPFQCKFCISSFHNKPFRNRSFKNIKETIERACNDAVFDSMGLIGSCVSSHPKFYEICEFIIKKDKRLTIPSIRVEHVTSRIISVLERGKVKTITIAPETGGNDLRKSLGKDIKNETVLSVLKDIYESRISNVKLYFLIGLPNEKDENIDEIINLLTQASKLGFNRGSLRVSVNPFVPKFNTPFGKEIDNYLKENLNSFTLKFQNLQQKLKKIPAIKLKIGNLKKIVKNARLQAIISLGDEETFEFLLNYYREGATLGSLNRAEKSLNYSIDKHLRKVKSGHSPWII